MDGIRQVLGSLDQTSRAMLAERTAAFQRATYVRLFGTVLIIALLFSVLIIAGVLLRRAFRSVRAAEEEANAEQLRVSLDSLSQGISVFDAECRLVSWNHCFVELFAIPEGLLQVGTPYSAFVRHDWTDEEGDFLEIPGAARRCTARDDGPMNSDRLRADAQRRAHLRAAADAASRRRLRHLLYGHHAAASDGAAAPTGAAAGRRRPAHRRCRPRLQQPADGDHRQPRPAAAEEQ
jgi:PAS domain-containing protein